MPGGSNATTSGRLSSWCTRAVSLGETRPNSTPCPAGSRYLSSTLLAPAACASAALSARARLALSLDAGVAVAVLAVSDSGVAVTALESDSGVVGSAEVASADESRRTVVSAAALAVSVRPL